MQTFLPYPDFKKSANCLDVVRLGNQRNECYTLLKTLMGLSDNWASHPACTMWINHPGWLAAYGLEICRAYSSRLDTVADKIKAFGLTAEPSAPPWYGDDRLHASHRSNLLRKDKIYYLQFGWREKDDLPYFWPESHDARLFAFQRKIINDAQRMLRKERSASLAKAESEPKRQLTF